MVADSSSSASDVNFYTESVAFDDDIYILETVGTVQETRSFLLTLVSPTWHHKGLNLLGRRSDTGGDPVVDQLIALTLLRWY